MSKLESAIFQKNGSNIPPAGARIVVNYIAGPNLAQVWISMSEGFRKSEGWRKRFFAWGAIILTDVEGKKQLVPAIKNRETAEQGCSFLFYETISWRCFFLQ